MTLIVLIVDPAAYLLTGLLVLTVVTAVLGAIDIPEEDPRPYG